MEGSRASRQEERLLERPPFLHSSLSLFSSGPLPDWLVALGKSGNISEPQFPHW